jgi:hypothetical protein
MVQGATDLSSSHIDQQDRVFAALKATHNCLACREPVLRDQQWCYILAPHNIPVQLLVLLSLPSCMKVLKFLMTSGRVSQYEYVSMFVL